MDDHKLQKMLDRVPEHQRDELLHRIERLTLLGWRDLGLMACGETASVDDVCGVPPGEIGVRLPWHGAAPANLLQTPEEEEEEEEQQERR